MFVGETCFRHQSQLTESLKNKLIYNKLAPLIVSTATVNDVHPKLRFCNFFSLFRTSVDVSSPSGVRSEVHRSTGELQVLLVDQK